MTLATSKALQSDLRRLTRRLAVAIGCEPNPVLRTLMQVVYDVGTGLLAFVVSEEQRAGERTKEAA